MNPYRRNALVIAALALATAIATVSLWPQIAGRQPPAPSMEKLTLAVNRQYIASGLVLLAARKGYFAAQGLEVTLQPHTSGRSALDAVIADKADMATVADTPVVFATMKNVPLAIVATISNALRTHGIVARRDRGISAPADMRGKTIGVVRGSDAHYLLTVMLASHGISSDEVTIDNIHSEELDSALAAGRVDAIAAWEPWLSEARRAAGTTGITFDPDRGFSLAFNLVGRRGFVKSNPAMMEKLLRALLAAERFIGAEPETARALVLEATNIAPAAFDSAWPNHSLRLTLSQATISMLEDQARWAIANGHGQAAQVPNFLESVYLDAMLAVKPQAVSIVR